MENDQPIAIHDFLIFDYFFYIWMQCTSLYTNSNFDLFIFLYVCVKSQLELLSS